jgi:sugar/nucleoside kinase (ribokinase family)
MADLTVIGHIAIDKIITHDATRTQIGGPPAYVALAAGVLGREVEAITKVGGDMPDDFLTRLSDLGIDLQGMVVEEAPTTRFTIDYRGVERSLMVESVCVEIGLEDVRWVPEAAIVAPIVGEVSPATIAGIGADVIALDPQGYLREVLDDGSIRPKPWFNGEALRRVDVFKSSVRELELVTGERDPWNGLERILRLGVEVAMATKGEEGSLLAFGAGRHVVPAHAAVSVDPTGAGDAFLGCFFLEYLEGEEPLWCASMGSAVASFVVETMGAEIGASSEDIRERAEDVFNRSKKI